MYLPQITTLKPPPPPPPPSLFLAIPRRLFCFGSLVILDVMCRYLSLFLSYIKIKIGKNRSMLNVRLAGDHLYWKWLFIWQSLVMSLVASFCAVLFTVYVAPWAEIIILILLILFREVKHKENWSL